MFDGSCQSATIGMFLVVPKCFGFFDIINIEMVKDLNKIVVLCLINCVSGD